MYQKGLMEFYIEQKDEAKETFKRVLKTDREAYKKDALYNLAAIAIDQKEYRLGLEYLDESKKHSKMYMCGVEYETDSLKFQRMYDKCLVAINQKQ
jgi:tetratricopeptide (TPR) repeat protein